MVFYTSSFPSSRVESSYLLLHLNFTNPNCLNYFSFAYELFLNSFDCISWKFVVLICATYFHYFFKMLALSFADLFESWYIYSFRTLKKCTIIYG